MPDDTDLDFNFITSRSLYNQNNYVLSFIPSNYQAHPTPYWGWLHPDSEGHYRLYHRLANPTCPVCAVTNTVNLTFRER